MTLKTECCASTHVQKRPLLTSRPSRQVILARIHNRLAERGHTLNDAIAERSLYFRISLVGACNLSCPFCHNEGAPTTGKIKREDVDEAISCA